MEAEKTKLLIAEQRARVVEKGTCIHPFLAMAVTRMPTLCVVAQMPKPTVVERSSKRRSWQMSRCVDA